MALFDKKKKNKNTVEIDKDKLAELMTQANSGSGSMFSYGLAESLFMSDLDDRILVIDREIDETMFATIDTFIMKINASDKNVAPEDRLPIKLIISSGGGSVVDGLGTINCIVNSITPIIGICTSYAYSMAFNIFVACHIRIAAKNATFLNHDGATMLSDSSSKAVDAIEFYRKVDTRMNQMVASRSKLSLAELENNRRIENYYFGDEGKNLGFVDYLIGEDVDFEDIFISEDSNTEETCDCDCDGSCSCNKTDV